MRRRILGVLLIIAGAATTAEPGGETTDQKQELIDIMKSVDLVPQMGKDDPLCRSFYEDFRQQRHIEHVRPIVKADKYDDPALQPYREKCPTLEMHKVIGFYPRDIQLFGFPDDEEEAESRAASITYGLRNFQMFRVDIDNNPADGEEYIIYYEGNHDEISGVDNPEDRTYQMIDFEQCRRKPVVIANQGGSAQWSRNGIIRYRGKNAIYELTSTDKREYWALTLYMYMGRLGRIVPVCAYYKSR